MSAGPQIPDEMNLSKVDLANEVIDLAETYERVFDVEKEECVEALAVAKSKLEADGW